MKKFLRTTITIVVIIVLICLVNKLGILDFFSLELSEEKLREYSDYYFNQLDENEQKIYISIDETIQNNRKTVYVFQQDLENISERISTVLTAYFYDNPDKYYISNEYIIKTTDVKLFNCTTITLQYIVEDIYAKDKLLQETIDNILKSCLRDGMTDFQKELAIHDALVKHVDYFQFEDINTIPAVKHTAYGALVEKEAVCDGYSKAFNMLLDEAGVNCVIVNGIVDGIAHAWNLVMLEGDYYNVDITSNALKENQEKYVIHTYFNVTDSQISKTHILDKSFEHPSCKAEKYNYYKYYDYYLKYEDNTYTKLKSIIDLQKDQQVLELQVDGKYYTQTIIDTLYDLNFNGWRTNGKTKVEYSKVHDVYIFAK